MSGWARSLSAGGRIVLLSTVLSVLATTLAPSSHADDAVTYEIFSDSSISMMYNIEYVDSTGRKLLANVPIPWRLEVVLPDAAGPTARGGAQLRADWRPIAWPGRYVVASISRNGKLLCRSAIDVGNVACYGNTPHVD